MVCIVFHVRVVSEVAPELSWSLIRGSPPCPYVVKKVSCDPELIPSPDRSWLCKAFLYDYNRVNNRARWIYANAWDSHSRGFWFNLRCQLSDYAELKFHFKLTLMFLPVVLIVCVVWIKRPVREQIIRNGSPSIVLVYIYVIQRISLLLKVLNSMNRGG